MHQVGPDAVAGHGQVHAHRPHGRVRPVQLGQQREAFGVRRQHGVEQARPPARCFLAHLGHAGAAAEAYFAAVHGNLPRDGAQQRALAGAVAADEADAVAGLHAEVLPGGVEKRARSYPDFEIIGYNHEEIV